MNSDGIGLGLMISKAIIEKNEGKLLIHSDGINNGSIFAFSMKMIRQEEISESSRQPSESESSF